MNQLNQNSAETANPVLISKSSSVCPRVVMHLWLWNSPEQGHSNAWRGRHIRCLRHIRQTQTLGWGHLLGVINVFILIPYVVGDWQLVCTWQFAVHGQVAMQGIRPLMSTTNITERSTIALLTMKLITQNKTLVCKSRLRTCKSASHLLSVIFGIEIPIFFRNNLPVKMRSPNLAQNSRTYADDEIRKPRSEGSDHVRCHSQC